MAAAAPQQAGSVQTPPPAALGAGLHQCRRTVPGGHRPGLCRQLRAGARLCGAAPRQAGSCRADTADGAAGDRLAHPPPQDPDEDEQPLLKTVLERCAELRAAAGHVRAFGELLTRLRGQELPGWIAAVRADGLPGLSGFAAGLEHDIDAVACGLTTRWCSGPVEGRVNHIKMLKRQMYGRAGLPLLRKRVLLIAAGGSRAGKRAR